jgi:hypothetical protein
MPVERKGLRFEVYPTNVLGHTDPSGGIAIHQEWEWTLVGADGPVCRSATTYDTEKECRSALAANKGRLKGSGYAKVITVDSAPEPIIHD